MPTYEYTCPNCGANFELFQSMRDAPIQECPQCHQPGVKRLVGGGAGLIFKGSGFYITDYRKKPGPAGGEGKPAAGSGESKPAAPAPAAPAAPAASASATASDKK